MAFRKSKKLGSDKVDINMTPMIDVVFQLLAFFVMMPQGMNTEGDFFIKMPPASAAAGSVTEALAAPLNLKLRADANGGLAGILLDDKAFTSFAQLNQYLVGYVASNQALADATEVEIDADYRLKYDFTMRAITAVSGYLTPNGQTAKLIDKIKFTPPKAQ